MQCRISLSHVKLFTQAGEGSWGCRRGWGLNLKTSRSPLPLLFVLLWCIPQFAPVSHPFFPGYRYIPGSCPPVPYTHAHTHTHTAAVKWATMDPSPCCAWSLVHVHIKSIIFSSYYICRINLPPKIMGRISEAVTKADTNHSLNLSTCFKYLY